MDFDDFATSYSNRKTDTFRNLLIKDLIPDDFGTLSDKKSARSGWNDMEIRRDDVTKSRQSTTVASCSKSHGHANFVRLSDFTAKHLPRGFRCREIRAYALAVGGLVVKLTVRTVSPHRQSTEKYRISVPPRTPVTRQGTGWVCPITDDGDVPDRIPCSSNSSCSSSSSCSSRRRRSSSGCSSSSSSSSGCNSRDVEEKNGNNPHHDVIGPFYVITARHLVYDHVEAASTSIHFMDDNDDDEDNDDTSHHDACCPSSSSSSSPSSSSSSPSSASPASSSSSSKSRSWTAKGVDVVYSTDEDRDFIYVECFSHNLDLSRRLRSATENMANAAMALRKRRPIIVNDQTGTDNKRNDENDNNDNNDNDNKLTAFIISHPHNRPKHISFGPVTVEDEKELHFDLKTGVKRRGQVCYSYLVDTCRGSSGAPVCVLGMDGAQYYLAPHSSSSKAITAARGSGSSNSSSSSSSSGSSSNQEEEEKEEEEGGSRGRTEALVEWGVSSKYVWAE